MGEGSSPARRAAREAARRAARKAARTAADRAARRAPADRSGGGTVATDGATEESSRARSVRLSSRSARVEVVAEERDDVVVEKGGDIVELPGSGPITVSSRTSPLRARVPVGTDVVVGTGSGRTALTGHLGKVAVATASGRVSIESAERVDVRSVGGRVEIGSCEGSVRVDTISGRVSVGRVGSAWLSAKTGRITVDEVRGLVRARSVTGRVTVRITAAPVDAKLETVSGRIEVTVPDDARPAQSFTARRGSIRSRVPEGDEGSVRARTVSGAIRLTGA